MGIMSKASVLGLTTGKIGRVVVCKLGLQIIMRSAPGKHKTGTKTPKGVSHNTMFKSVTGMVGKLTKGLPKGLIKLTYQLPVNATYTAKNAMTKQVWSDALRGKYPDHYIDLSLVKFSNPLLSTEKARNAKFAIVDDELLVSWELNPLPKKTTRLDDKIYVVCFDIDKRVMRLVCSGVERKALFFNDKLRYQVSGFEYCFWLFIASADGKRVSETQFLGAITIP